MVRRKPMERRLRLYLRNSDLAPWTDQGVRETCPWYSKELEQRYPLLASARLSVLPKIVVTHLREEFTDGLQVGLGAWTSGKRLLDVARRSTSIG